MKETPVIVTGMGFCLPSAGPQPCRTKEQFWEIIRGGTDCTCVDANGVRAGFVAADDATLLTHIEGLSEKYFARYSALQRYALASVSEALGDAGLSRSAFDRDDIGVIATPVTVQTMYEALDGFMHIDLDRASVDEVKRVYHHMGLSAGRNDVSNVVGDYVQTRGSVFALACGCASGVVAAGVAIDKIRSGEWSLCLLVGSDAFDRQILRRSMHFKQALCGGMETDEQIRFASEPMRPYDERAAGVVFGTGAAALVLESAAHAAARRAPNTYGELVRQRLGRGANATAIALDTSGVQVVTAVRRACEGVVDIDRVEYVNGGAQGDKVFNSIEGRAMAALYGPAVTNLRVSSQEGCFGHAGGCVGNVGLAATLLMMQRGYLCPTANCEKVDPVCGFDPLPGRGVPRKVEWALSLNYQAAGIAAATLLRAA